VLIEAGLDALTLKTLMGHASVHETFDTYGHLFPNQSERAAAAVTARIHRDGTPDHVDSRTVSRTAEGIAAGQSA
jgi:hypothetical protein